MIKVVPTQLFFFLGGGDLHTTGITASTFLLLVPPGKMARGHLFLSLKRTIHLMFSKQLTLLFCFVYVRHKGQKEPCNKVGPLSMDKHLVGA